MVKNALFGDKHLIRPAISWESGGIGGQVAWGNLWVNFGGPMGSPYKWPKINWVLLWLFHPYEWNYTPYYFDWWKGAPPYCTVFFWGGDQKTFKSKGFCKTIHPYFFGFFQPQNCGGTQNLEPTVGPEGCGCQGSNKKDSMGWLILHYGL